MPIYAYKCDACGHAKDVLQKLSDPPVTVCPVCGADAFRKQLTAAGFQLKGSGWYATDFKGGAKAPETGDKAADSKGDAAPGDAKPADKAGEAKPAEKAGSEPKAASTPPPPAPVTGSEK